MTGTSRRGVAPGADPQRDRDGDRSQSERRSGAGWEAALIGPLVGLLQIRSGAAFERNEVGLNRFLDHWQQEAPDLRVESFVFAPRTTKSYPENRPDDGPLSWHLTTEQKKSFRERWGTTPDDPNEAQLKELAEFLASGPGDGETPIP